MTRFLRSLVMVIAIPFVLIAALVVAMGLIGQRSLHQQAVADAANAAEQSKINDLRLRCACLRLDVHHFLGTSTPQEMERLGASITAAGAALRQDVATSGNVADEVKGLEASYQQILALHNGFQTKKAVVLNNDEALKRHERIMASLAAEVTASINRAHTQAQTRAQGNQRIALLLNALAALIVAASAISLWWLVARPVSKAAALADSIASGDYVQRLNLSGQGEVGRLCTALDRMAGRLAERADENVRLLAQVRSVAASTGGLANHATSLRQTSASAAIGAMQASQDARSVADGLDLARQTLNEIAASSKGIITTLERANVTVNKAAESTTQATNAIQALGGTSREVGNIVGIIARIASQTNLLALNASIEAASAGAMGKGFAVVASEVKDLAGKTTTSAQDIARRLTGMQQQVEAAMTAVSDLTNAVQGLESNQSEVSSTVQDQSTTLTSVASNLDDTVQSNQAVVASMAAVAQRAQSAQDIAVTVDGIASETAMLSLDLDRFVAEMKS